MTDQRGFALNANVSRRCATGDDEGFCFHPNSIDLEAMRCAGFEFLDDSILKAGSEFFRLLVHALDEFRAINTIREAWEIFDSGCCRELTARQAPFENERRQIGASRVNGCSETGTSRANDNDIFHRSAE